MSALAAEWLPPMMAGGSRTAAIMPQLAAMVERSTPDIYAGQINALLNRPDALPVLPTIDVPTLLLSGSEDTWSPVSQHETMRRRIPHATCSRFTGPATWRRSSGPKRSRWRCVNGCTQIGRN